jgi:hypothetical protein
MNPQSRGTPVASRNIDQNKKTQVHRNRELSEMTADGLRRWAQDEVARALDRESTRATHAARLDDCVRSLICRLSQLIDTEPMSDTLKDKLVSTILMHNELRMKASD